MTGNSPGENYQNRKAQKAPLSDPLVDQVSRDLRFALSKYKSQNFGMRHLSQKTNISEKTLQRLIQRQNKASYPTLFRLYNWLTQATTEEELLKKAPQIVSDLLKAEFNAKIKNKKPEKFFNFLELIKERPLMGEIYVLSLSNDLHKNEIQLRFREYGVQILEELVNKDLLRRVNKTTFTASPTGPQFDEELIKTVGLRVLQRFLKPDQAIVTGENFMSFYTQGLNREGLNKWLEIDKKAFYDKLEISNKSQYQGDHRTFSFMAIDSMDEPQQGEN